MPGSDKDRRSLFYDTGKCVFRNAHYCPLRCGETIFLKDKEDHVNNRCVNRKALCPRGCGERIVGSVLDSGQHDPACAMAAYLEKAELALRECNIKDLRKAMDGAHRERGLARAKMVARGEKDPGPNGWTTEPCTRRVDRIQVETAELLTRCRNRAKERLVAALALYTAPSANKEYEKEKSGIPSAFKFWDQLHSDELIDRVSRPWDLHGADLQPLLEALEDAALCGADEDLRRRGEALLITSIQRAIEAALIIVEDRRTILLEVGHRAEEALRLVELEDILDLPNLLEKLHTEVHRATLQELPEVAPEFHEAVAAGDMDLCAWLLERERANPSELDPRTGLPPLIIAAKAADITMCKLLLENGADVDVRSRADGMSALHWAAHTRSARMVVFLLSARANPRLQDKRGQDALMKLVRRDFDMPAIGCVHSWEQREGQLKGRILNSGFMTLERAQALAEQEGACMGISFQAASGDQEGHFYITLHTAQPPESHEEDPTEDPESFTTFLKVGTDPAHDIRELLASGADPCATDSLGLTALHHHLASSPSGGCMIAVAALLQGGSDVNQRDRSHRSTTAFIQAVAARRADLVKLMLERAFPPPDVDARTSDGTCILDLAESVASHEVAAVLKKAGASTWGSSEFRLGKRTLITVDTRQKPVTG